MKVKEDLEKKVKTQLLVSKENKLIDARTYEIVGYLKKGKEYFYK